jgi:hypothetical protein
LPEEVEMTKRQKRTCIIVPLVIFGLRLAFTIPSVGLCEALRWLVDDFWGLLAFSALLVFMLAGETPEDDGIAGEFWKHRE